MDSGKVVITALGLIYKDSGKDLKVEELKELLNYINRFRSMSIDNALLLRVQKPDCEYAASEMNWKIYDKRKLKPEAKPLIIFRWDSAKIVYALSDTKGKKYILDWNMPECDVELFYDYYKNIVFNMKSIGIDLIKQAVASKIAGRIKVVDAGEFIELDYKGKEYLIKATHTIIVSDTLPDREIFSTIVHELGHYYCGHCGDVNNELLKIFASLQKEEILTHEQEEFEAECASHIVCSRNRIISDTKEQFWTYLDENKKISKKSISRILDAVIEIEKMLCGMKEPINGYIKISDI